jgi:hypothetical protein
LEFAAIDSIKECRIESKDSILKHRPGRKQQMQKLAAVWVMVNALAASAMCAQEKPAQAAAT